MNEEKIPTVQELADVVEEAGDLDGAMVAYFYSGTIEVKANAENPRYLRGLEQLIDLRAGALECRDEANELLGAHSVGRLKPDAVTVRSRGDRMHVVNRLLRAALWVLLFGAGTIRNNSNKIDLHTDE